jgi:hypothetical protein
MDPELIKIVTGDGCGGNMPSAVFNDTRRK